MQAVARVDHFMAVEGRQTCSLDDNWSVSTLGLATRAVALRTGRVTGDE